MTQQVWFITGCSRGFGQQFVKSILARGDKVFATARKTDDIENLKALGAAVMQLDMAADASSLAEKWQQAYDIYGRVDVLVMNAGYAQVGAFEDLTYVTRCRRHARFN